MISKIKRIARSSLVNIAGWQTKKRIVVIESDDWGCIRMPSKDIYNLLKRKGFNVDQDPYLKYDSLASEEDLSSLFETLSSVVDSQGNPAVLTANSVVANPDFTKIKNNDYSKYYYETFVESLNRYPKHAKSFNLWQEGIRHKLFFPQFHGREHLNVHQWMSELKENNQNLRLAFEHGMINITSIPGKLKFGYLESFDFFSKEEQLMQNNIVVEGLELFNKIHKYKSKSFIANCYIWHSQLEKTLKENNVDYIQGILNQMEPVIAHGNHKYKYIKHFTGQKNTYGQKYIIRNVHFEPSIFPDIDWVDKCMEKIAVAFFWNKPAVISSHRLNFIGWLSPTNRDNNLILLKKLLKSIKRKWPDVVFLNTCELGDMIK